MYPIGRLALAGALICAAAGNAEAARDRSFFTIGAGAFDINDDYTAANFNLEWRAEPWFWNLRPFVGGSVTTDAGLYGYAGLALDIYFGEHVVVTPNFAPALYEEGDGKDLGYALEFRSGIEVAWRFEDRSRLGIALHHLSNAGLGDDNPGTETLMLNYSMPTHGLLGY